MSAVTVSSGGLAVDARQHRERGPAAEVVDAEQRQGLADRADLEPEPEERRVDVAQQAEAERHVAADLALELTELHARILERGDDLEQRRAVGDDSAVVDQLGLAEEEALEQLAAELDAPGVVLVRLDLLGEQGHAVGPQASGLAGHALAAHREHVELDHVDEPEHPLGADRVHEVVEREPVAEALEVDQRVDEALVEQLVLEDLEPDDAGRQRPREAAEDELARDVDPRRVAADEPLEPDLGERVRARPTRSRPRSRRPARCSRLAPRNSNS